MPPAKPKLAPSLVASAARVRLDRKGDARRLMYTRQPWQQIAWTYFHAVGEVAYGATFLGDALSKLRIFGAELADKRDQAPTPTENPVAIREAERLDSGAGHSGIMREAGINLSVAGEGFLVGETGGDGETWDLKSMNELIVSADGKAEIRSAPGGELKALNPEQSLIVRIWLRDPEFSDLAWSPLRGVLDQCELLIYLEQAKRAQALNRAWSGGILKVPTELTFGPPDPTQDTSDGEERKDPFMDQLLEAMITPIQDRGSASAVVPLLVRGPGEILKNLDLLKFDRPFDPQIDVAIMRAIRRLAQGLNVPIEVIEGAGGINHWNLAVINEDTFNMHIEPLALVILDALTDGYYRPALRAAGVKNPERFVLWYDASRLVQPPDKAETAKTAYTAPVPAISGAAYRRVMGMGDDDAPSEREILLQGLLGRGRWTEEQTTALLAYLLPEIAAKVTQSIDGTANEETTPDAPVPEPVPVLRSQPAAPAVEASAVSDNGHLATRDRTPSDLGARLLEIDRTLRTRLTVAADGALRRALEKSGAQIRTKAKGSAAAAIRDIPNEGVAAALGPAVVAQAGLPEDSQFVDMFEPLHAQFDAWVADAQEEALSLVPGLSAGQIDELSAQQEEERNDAWLWLLAAIVALVKERLYDPELGYPEGEADLTSLVPAGLIRQAMARAGGAAGLIEGSGFVATLPGGEPLGEVGLGQTIRAALAGQGVVTEGYRWVYGRFPRRAFQPHMDLDQIIFSNWDDEVLRNPGSWPPVEFLHAGDHDGCGCSFEPVLIAPQILPDPVIASAGAR